MGTFRVQQAATLGGACRSLLPGSVALASIPPLTAAAIPLPSSRLGPARLPRTPFPSACYLLRACSYTALRHTLKPTAQVAHRLGLPMVGVNIPGHFMISPADPELEFLVDAFQGEQGLCVALSCYCFFINSSTLFDFSSVSLGWC